MRRSQGSWMYELFFCGIWHLGDDSLLPCELLGDIRLKPVWRWAYTNRLPLPAVGEIRYDACWIHSNLVKIFTAKQWDTSFVSYLAARSCLKRQCNDSLWKGKKIGLKGNRTRFTPANNTLISLLTSTLCNCKPTFPWSVHKPHQYQANVLRRTMMRNIAPSIAIASKRTVSFKKALPNFMQRLLLQAAQTFLTVANLAKEGTCIG